MTVPKMPGLRSIQLATLMLGTDWFTAPYVNHISMTLSDRKFFVVSVQRWLYRANKKQVSTFITNHISPSCCAALRALYMMTSSNGNIFRVTGPLCGEFTGPGEFPTQRPVIFDVFFDLRLNKRLSKQLWGWWFETLSRPLCRHRNDNQINTDTSKIRILDPWPVTRKNVSIWWRHHVNIPDNAVTKACAHIHTHFPEILLHLSWSICFTWIMEGLADISIH